MSEKAQIEAAVSLFTRLPPSKVKQSLAAISNLQPDLQETILQKIDQPFGMNEKLINFQELEMDTKASRQFIKSEYNRDGDSYRSPYSNEYFPPLEEGYEGLKPSEDLRDLEVKLNTMFEEYVKLYYKDGVVNAFTWATDDGWTCAVLIHRECEHAQNVKSGFWNSINLMQVIPNGELKQTVYKLTTTVILELVTIHEKAGEVALSGYQTARKEETRVNENNEIACLTAIGTLIENHESTLRSNLEAVYFGKTQEIISKTRYEAGRKDNEALGNKLRQGLYAAKKE